MTERISPQPYARICGALYLYIIVAGIFAEVFVRSRLIVPADAAATATNIIANEQLFRLGFSGELLHLAFDVAVAALLYALLRPVNRTVALPAAFMRLVSDIILAVVSVSHFATLRLLADTEYLKTFQPEQLQALALLALKLHGDGYNICLFFFGFACLALGYLIFRSTFLPRVLGVLLAISGLGFVARAFASVLAPAYASPFLLIPTAVAWLLLTLWLLVRGVDDPKWQKSAALANHRSP